LVSISVAHGMSSFAMVPVGKMPKNSFGRLSGNENCPGAIQTSAVNTK